MRLPKGAQADAPITVPDVTVGSATVEVVNANSLKAFLAGGLVNMNVVYATNSSGNLLGTSETTIQSVTITPRLSTSKILVLARVYFQKDGGTTRRSVESRLYRTPSTLLGQYAFCLSHNVDSSFFGPGVHMAIDAAHNTTSPVTYRLYGLCDAANVVYPVRWEMVALELVS